MLVVVSIKPLVTLFIWRVLGLELFTTICIVLIFDSLLGVVWCYGDDILKQIKQSKTYKHSMFNLHQFNIEEWKEELKVAIGFGSDYEIFYFSKLLQLPDEELLSVCRGSFVSDMCSNSDFFIQKFLAGLNPIERDIIINEFENFKFKRKVTITVNK